MPDIQAGEIEMTKEEALNQKSQKNLFPQSILIQDETGEVHTESVYNHLGRS
ncbi:MAG TPA: hypothetical protein VJ824_17400 [Bacillota bacterium]|nr:hypothetical protein [Bacillota bacterium]